MGPSEKPIFRPSEHVVWQCPTCDRLWVIRWWPKLAPPERLKADVKRVTSMTVGPISIGQTHFAGKEKSFRMCWGTPLEVDRPDVLAAFHLGGHDAVNEINAQCYQDPSPA